MDSLEELLKKKADLLDSPQANDMKLIQRQLDVRFPNSVVAKKLQDGSLTVHTKISAIASELRLNQVDIIDSINTEISQPIDKLVILIR